MTRTGDVAVNTQSEHATWLHHIAAPTTRPNSLETRATQTKGLGSTNVLRWPRPAAKLLYSSFADLARSPRGGKMPATKLPSGSSLKGRISTLLRTRRRHRWLRGKRDVPGQKMIQRHAILALWEASGHVHFAAAAEATAGDRSRGSAPLHSRARANGLRIPGSADHKEDSDPDLRAPPPSSHQLQSLRSNKDQSTTRNSPIKIPKSPRNVPSSAGKPRRPVSNEEGNPQSPRHAPLGSDNDNDNGDNYGYDNGGHGYEGCVYFTASSSSSPLLPSSMSVEGEGGGGAVRAWRQHMVETVLTVVVKDINDNAPLFPKDTIYGQVQENGAASE